MSFFLFLKFLFLFILYGVICIGEVYLFSDNLEGILSALISLGILFYYNTLNNITLNLYIVIY